MLGSKHKKASDAYDQDVTVIFADISGFTAMSEKLDPEQVTDIMNRCFAELEGVVIAYGGQIDKYIGDCVMAVFGVDEETCGARAAVTASAEIIKALAEFNVRERLHSPLGVHIGVEAGTALISQIGGANHRAVTVSGLPVTIATRLEDVSDVGQIFVGPASHAETAEFFDYEERDSIEVRNASAPVRVFEYKGPKRTRESVKRDSERRQASVVFASISGLQELAAKQSPAERNETLNLCFAALEAAVNQYGGVIDKYIGETVMALFGVPDAIEDAPTQSINAVIEMRRRLGELSESEQIPARLGLSAGINSGLVVAGEIGGRAKRDFTVMGDTVNLAARLKEAASVGDIFIGPETYRYTEGDFDFGEPVPLDLKGKSEPIPARRVLSETGKLGRSTRGRSASGKKRTEAERMVGRAEELEISRLLLTQLSRGTGGAVFITGEAGVGKTRLLNELLALPERDTAGVLEGRCLSLGSNLSFHPFVDLLRRWAGIGEDDSDGSAESKLEEKIRDILPDSVEDVYPFIAKMMGQRLSEAYENRVRGIEGEALENMITNAARELLLRLSRIRPLALVIEDVHWADRSSIKLLDTLLRLPLQTPLLFVFVSRPDFEATTGHLETHAAEVLGESSQSIALQPLSPQDSVLLAQELLDIDDLPVSFRQILARKAEGNPFYIEEVVRSLIDSGAIVERDGRYQVTQKIETVEIPNTIQEVIMSRVDRLDEATRHVVQIAAVIGRTALFSIIAEILQQGDKLGGGGEAELSQLKQKQLLLERTVASPDESPTEGVTGELEFVFKHALAQETIYASLLQKVRRELHERVAVAIESLFADRLSDFFGMLAYHYSRTDQLTKAEDYLFKAGDEAASSAASGEALNFFRDAYQIYQQIHGDAGDPARRAELERRIAQALLNTGEQTEAIDHFDEALRLMGEPVPKTIYGAGVRFLGDFASVVFHIFARRGFRTPPDSVDIEHERAVCEIFYHRGQAETTSDPTRLFLELPNGVRRLNRIDPRNIDRAGAIYVTAALIYAYSGFSFTLSRRMLDTAHSLVRPDNPRDQFAYRVFNYVYHYLLGNWDDQHAISLEDVRTALGNGQVWDATLFVGLEIDRVCKRGHFDQTGPLLDLLQEINDNYGYSYAQSNRNGMYAVVLLQERRLREAADLAHMHYIESDEPPIRVFSLGIEARARAMLGEIEQAKEALDAADTAMAKADSIPAWHLSSYNNGRLYYALARLRRGDKPSEVRKEATSSVRRALWTSRFVARNRVETYRLAADLMAALGKQRRAKRLYTAALREGEKLGVRPELARVHASLATFMGANDSALLGGTAQQHRELAARELAALGLDWDLQALLPETEPQGKAA